MPIAGLTKRIDQIAELVRNTAARRLAGRIFAIEDNIRATTSRQPTFKPGDAAARFRARARRKPASNMRSWRRAPSGMGGPSPVLDEIKRANLRGRGGAGSPPA